MADEEEMRRRQVLYRGAIASAAGVAGLATLGEIFLGGDDGTTDQNNTETPNGTPTPPEDDGTPTSPEPDPTDDGTPDPTDEPTEDPEETGTDNSGEENYRDPIVSSLNMDDLPQYKDLNQEFDIEATVSGYDLSHIELGYRIAQDESGRGSTDYVELQTDEIDDDGFTEYTIEFDDYEHSREEVVEFYAVAESDDGDTMEDSEVVEFLDF